MRRHTRTIVILATVALATVPMLAGCVSRLAFAS